MSYPRVGMVSASEKAELTEVSGSWGRVCRAFFRWHPRSELLKSGGLLSPRPRLWTEEPAPPLWVPLPDPLVWPWWCGRLWTPKALERYVWSRGGRQSGAARKAAESGPCTKSAWVAALCFPSYQDPAARPTEVFKAPCSHVFCENVSFIHFLSVPRTFDFYEP